MLFSLIGGFATGALVGLLLVAALSIGRASYKSKRECRECLRTRVEYGFCVDGKDYKCVEDTRKE